MPFSTNLANEMLDHTFAGDEYTQPTEWWVQLHYGDPGADGTANAFVFDNAEYDTWRQSHSTWSNSTTGSLSNEGVVEFVNMPEVSGHDTVTHISIMTAVSGGSVYAYGELATSRTFAEGDILSFAAGEIDVSIV